MGESRKSRVRALQMLSGTGTTVLYLGRMSKKSRTGRKLKLPIVGGQYEWMTRGAACSTVLRESSTMENRRMGSTQHVGLSKCGSLAWHTYR